MHSQMKFGSFEHELKSFLKLSNNEKMQELKNSMSLKHADQIRYIYFTNSLISLPLTSSLPSVSVALAVTVGCGYMVR